MATAKTGTCTRKGEIVHTLNPWKVIPLFAETKVDLLLSQSKLPHYVAADHNPLAVLLTEQQTPVPKNIPQCQKLFRRREDVGDNWSIYTVLSTISLALQGVTSIQNDTAIPSSRGQDYQSHEEESELSCEAWTWVQDHITWMQWRKLHRYVQDHLCTVSQSHPLETYAIQTVPFLTKEEVHQVVTTLGMESDFFPSNKRKDNNHLSTVTSTSTLAMRLSQLLKDEYLPRNYGILFSPSGDASKCGFRHGCLPSAALELESPIKVNFIALYDDDDDPDDSPPAITSCTLPLDGGGMEREARRRCASRGIGDGPCLLCQRGNQKKQSTPASTNSWKATVRFGHYYFQQGQYQEAASCYHLVLQQNDTLDDIRHALGALQLAQGKFLDAQLAWRNAASEMTASGRSPESHPGIGLQLKKQQAYNYLQVLDDAPAVDQSPKNVTYNSRSYFDNQCFVTPMLKETDCQRLIEIANKHGGWTSGRHYAIPTNDIPVHDVPELLEWFYPWMERECEPLLRKQFQVQQQEHNHKHPQQRFYVHDAFVVRYQGSGEKTNHLPCHLDECTHSFVICLNDGFEGGGTYFHDYNTVLSPNVGDVVTFKGDSLRHGGDAVIRGTRYILAAFLYLDRCYSTADEKSNHAEARPPEKNTRSEDSHSTKHQIQPLFKEAKKQKTEFSFGFNLQYD